MKTNLILIRHAKSRGNAEKRLQGRDDSPLGEEGLIQAELLKNCLSNEPIDVVYCSPLKRAVDTAEISMLQKNIPFIKEEGLLERNFGILDGLKLEDLKKMHPSAKQFFHGQKTELNFGGIETIPNLTARSTNALKKIVNENQGKTIAIVSHLFWIKSILSKILEQPYKETAKNYRIGNASITTLTHENEKFTIEKIGEKEHL